MSDPIGSGPPVDNCSVYSLDDQQEEELLADGSAPEGEESTITLDGAASDPVMGLEPSECGVDLGYELPDVLLEGDEDAAQALPLLGVREPGPAYSVDDTSAGSTVSSPAAEAGVDVNQN